MKKKIKFKIRSQRMYIISTFKISY